MPRYHVYRLYLRDNTRTSASAAAAGATKKRYKESVYTYHIIYYIIICSIIYTYILDSTHIYIVRYIMCAAVHVGKVFVKSNIKTLRKRNVCII